MPGIIRFPLRFVEFGPWPKDNIYAVTNIGVDLSMYIQIFILAKATFFLKGIQRSTFIIKKRTNKSKTGILMELTKILVIIAKDLLTRKK